ncbi:glycosyltransferase [Streptomyces sp. NPDC056707]|uniref:glycosyltransferase n=1 Tax=Streptomyces sp. NPDC056707 TaxID=3345919 RepID=UPI0036B31665
MLAGFQELPANVVVTIGACVAPTGIEPLPDHIRVEQFISQELLLPKRDPVVSHGGSGSLMGAFAQGPTGPGAPGTTCFPRHPSTSVAGCASSRSRVGPPGP